MIPDSNLTTQVSTFTKNIKVSTLFFICFAGIAAVYLSHLGVVPIHAMADECRRALVALEMSISGDYLTPTLNGEPYLNKPPLYSWIIAASYHLVGNYSALALRLPVVLSILGHGLLIYFIVKRYCNPAVAAMTALAFMTNGRTLLFDSMLGLLEHTLALLLYAGFMAIFIFGEKKKYLLLFIVSYFLTAIGFLIKGLPSVAHQGIALLVYFIFSKKFKLLFSWYHFVGIMIFLLTIGAYYIPYFSHNELGPDAIFSKIFNESSKRYIFRGVGDFINILLDYPKDFIYHFLPWTLLLILLIRKNIFSVIRENKFVYYNILLFLANTPIYWFAALKNPHYLYFLLPLLFTLLFYIYFKFDKTDWRVKSIDILLWVGIGIAIVGTFYLPFNKLVSGAPGLWFKSIILFIAFASLFILYARQITLRLFIFVGAIIFIRLAFNWFVLPQRVHGEQVYLDRAAKINLITLHSPLYIMAEYPAGYYDGVTFFVEEDRNEILRLNHNVDYNAYYLVDDINLNKYPNDLLLQFPFVYMDNNLRYKKDMYLVKFTH